MRTIIPAPPGYNIVSAFNHAYTSVPVLAFAIDDDGKVRPITASNVLLADPDAALQAPDGFVFRNGEEFQTVHEFTAARAEEERQDRGLDLV